MPAIWNSMVGMPRDALLAALRVARAPARGAPRGRGDAGRVGPSAVGEIGAAGALAGLAGGDEHVLGFAQAPFGEQRRSRARCRGDGGAAPARPGRARAARARRACRRRRAAPTVATSLQPRISSNSRARLDVVERRRRRAPRARAGRSGSARVGSHSTLRNHSAARRWASTRVRASSAGSISASAASRSRRAPRSRRPSCASRSASWSRIRGIVRAKLDRLLEIARRPRRARSPARRRRPPRRAARPRGRRGRRAAGGERPRPRCASRRAAERLVQQRAAGVVEVGERGLAQQVVAEAEAAVGAAEKAAFHRREHGLRAAPARRARHGRAAGRRRR